MRYGFVLSLRRRRFGRRFKVLIGVGIRRGPRNDVEAELRRLMASVAPFRELIECFRESTLVLRFDRLIELADRRFDHLVDQLRKGKLRILMLLVIGGDILETLIELVQFIGGEGPVCTLSGEPELCVPHLLKRHDLAEARDIWRL